MPLLNSFALKLLAIAFGIAIIGAPFDSWPKFVLFLCFALAVVHSESAQMVRRLTRKRILLGVLGLLFAAAGAALPKLQIDEGSNIFAVGVGFEAFERDLPPAVFSDFREQFLLTYPQADWCVPPADPAYCWRGAHRVSRTYAFAPESVWQSHPPRSRFVGAIDFDGPETLHGAFVNALGYEGETLNWYNKVSDVRRESMPYFVSYKWDPRMNGGSLCWRGTLWWKTADSAFRKESHVEFKCEALDRSRLASTVYALSVPLRDPLSMRLIPEFKWRFFEALALSLRALGLAIFAFAALTIRKREFYGSFGLATLSAAGLGGVGYLLKFGRTIVFQGGDDGLAHYGSGRAAFQYFFEGNYALAWRAGERVFYARAAVFPSIRNARLRFNKFWLFTRRSIYRDRHFSVAAHRRSVGIRAMGGRACLCSRLEPRICGLRSCHRLRGNSRLLYFLRRDGARVPSIRCEFG